MSSDPDRSLRTLLETAVPRENVPAPLAAEIRAIGRRRQRRTQALSAAVAVAAVSAAAIVGFRVMASPTPSPPGPVTSATATRSASPSPTEKLYTVRDLGGTTWVLQLAWMGGSTVEAWPGDNKPGGPIAWFVFGTDHSLEVHYVEKGKARTILGTWEASTPDPAGRLDGAAQGLMTYHLDAPSTSAPESLQFLIARSQMVTHFGMRFDDQPSRTYLNGRMLASFADNVVNVFMYQVTPGTRLPGT